MNHKNVRFFASLGLVLATLLFCTTPTHLFAQTVSGTILGVVTDQQGAVIGKAEVSARSLDTGAIRKTISGDNGEYRITSIPARSYEISVTAPRFQTAVPS